MKKQNKKQLCKVVVTKGNVEDQFCIDIKCEEDVTFQNIIDYMTSVMVQTSREIVDNNKYINLYALKDDMMSVLNVRLNNFINEYLGEDINE